MTALTGGLAPAIADPDTDPIAPTTTVPAQEPEPEPEMTVPEETAAPEAPSSATPPTESAPPPEPPTVESPPQPQAPEPPPAIDQPTTQTAVMAQLPESPPTVAPAADEPPSAPRGTASSAIEQLPETPAAQTPASEAPDPTSAAEVTSASPTTTSAGSTPPAPELVAPSSEDSREPATDDRPTALPSKSATPEADPEAAEPQQPSATAPSAPSTISQVARLVETAEPETLQAPKQDVELARSAKPIELNPVPALKRDVDALSQAIAIPNRDRDDRNEQDVAGAFISGDGRWDRKVRQWDRNWVEYDQYYRPVIFNPYRAPVRIVYVYLNAPRIVVIPPLARIVVEAAQFAAYSFTAVVLNGINTAVNVAVGSFFGGGYYPGVGLPLPPPPPPVVRYDNVPVLVRYSQARYEPFRVSRIVDVGDDVHYGGRKVLLDGATPAWGVWTQTPTGERQFEVHRTQQFPGLGDPQEAPLPGDYPLRLASDGSSSGLDRESVVLIAAGGLTAGMGFGALALAYLLGRRRPEI